jgi:ABC-type nitrate/sulfonate/bicarbonate transport system substrate-binding protein
MVRSLLTTLFVALTLASAGAADPPAIRVVLVPAEGDADMYYAKDAGFFKDAGLDVQIVTIAAGQNIVGRLAARAPGPGSPLHRRAAEVARLVQRASQGDR